MADFQRVCDPASSLQPLRVHRAPLLAFCAAAPLRMVLRVASEVWVTELSECVPRSATCIGELPAPVTAGLLSA